jgi:methyl-accepting chemotaxis protein
VWVVKKITARRLEVKLPQFSIATKLYAIFALLATMTVGLAAVAAFDSYQHAALTEELQSAYEGTTNVERINALIYAVVMESRGIYMSPDVATAKVYGDGLLVFNDRSISIPISTGKPTARHGS